MWGGGFSVDAIILTGGKEAGEVFGSPVTTDRAAAGFVKSVCMCIIFLTNESGLPTLNCFRLFIVMICAA